MMRRPCWFHTQQKSIRFFYESSSKMVAMTSCAHHLQTLPTMVSDDPKRAMNPGLSVQMFMNFAIWTLLMLNVLNFEDLCGLSDAKQINESSSLFWSSIPGQEIFRSSGRNTNTGRSKRITPKACDGLTCCAAGYFNDNERNSIRFRENEKKCKIFW